MAATLKTVEGGRVTSMDDAAVRWALSNQNGIIQGCETTLSGNTVTVKPGRIMIYGRLVDITLTEITIPYTTTTQQGAVYVEIQPGNAQQPAQIGVMSAEGSVNLTQEDLMNGGTTYQFELATFNVNANEVTEFTETGAAYMNAAAYVVEADTDGIWEWIKYSNGFAVCVGQTTLTFTGNNGWDDGWYYSATTGPEFPFTWAKAPKAWVEKASLDVMDILTISKGATTTTAPSIRALKIGAYSGSQEHDVCIFAFGKWK